VTAKKAKGKAKGKKKPAEDSAEEPKKSPDLAEVRESINEMVKASATKIAKSVIDVTARTGQLSSARYLFEAVGIYPPSEQAEAGPREMTMAHQLLTRMGIPIEPVVREEDGETIIREVTLVDQPALGKERNPGENSGEKNPEGGDEN
jgi:hypothetical protein